MLLDARVISVLTDLARFWIIRELWAASRRPSRSRCQPRRPSRIVFAQVTIWREAPEKKCIAQPADDASTVLHRKSCDLPRRTRPDHHVRFRRAAPKKFCSKPQFQCPDAGKPTSNSRSGPVREAYVTSHPGARRRAKKFWAIVVFCRWRAYGE